MDDEEGDDSIINVLKARMEAYTTDPSCFDVSSQSKRHPDWLDDGSKRIEATSQLAEELMALQSIYTDDALQLLKIAPLSQTQTQSKQAPETDPHSWVPGSTLTISILTEFESRDSFGPIPIRVAATLPPFYPHSTKPPQLQLLSKYIGGFSVDSELFGEVLKAFHHQIVDHALASSSATESTEDMETHTDWAGQSVGRGIHWTSGEEVLFEGIEWVKERVSDWWTSHETARVQGGGDTNVRPGELVPPSEPALEGTSSTALSPKMQDAKTVFTGKLFVTPPIVDRKSEFVGYAAAISSPDDVPAILSHILLDKRVARAAHPIINAWVCKAQPDSNVVHRDCDDDGETAAGGRLAHLLSILELENVLVVVTRWFGGVHLGPDRFKLINRAAREALSLGGFLDKPSTESSPITTKISGKRSH